MFFQYKVTYYNEFDGKEVSCEGLTYAKTYSKAMKKVIEDYGEDSVIDVYLMGLADDNTIAKVDIDMVFKKH